MDKDFKVNFLKGSFSIAIGQIVTIAFHFLSMIIITRHISKEAFGIFALINAIYIAMQLLAGLGLDTTLVKYLSIAKKESIDKLFFTFLAIRIISLTVIGSIFIILTSSIVFFTEKINEYGLLILTIFILSSLRDFYYAQLQGVKRFRELAIIQVVSAVAKFILYTLGLILNLLDLDYLIYTEIGFLLISFIVQQFLVSITYNFKLKIDIQEIHKILRFAIPLYFNDLLALANNRTNSFIISGFLSNISLAYYRVATTIPDALYRIYSSFGTVYYPNVSSLFSENGIEEAGKFINRSLTSIALLIAPILFLTFMIKEEITVLLFTNKYLDSSFALFLLLIVFYFRAISNITGYSIVSSGNSLSSFKINFFSVIVGICCSFFLTPLWGFEGAIYSTLIASVLSSSLGIIFFRKIGIKLNPLKFLIPLFFSSVFILIYFIIGNCNLLFSTFIFFIYVATQYIVFSEFRELLIILYEFSFKYLARETRND